VRGGEGGERGLERGKQKGRRGKVSEERRNREEEEEENRRFRNTLNVDDFRSRAFRSTQFSSRSLLSHRQKNQSVEGADANEKRMKKKALRYKIPGRVGEERVRR
jgi:hypothetical protein